MLPVTYKFLLTLAPPVTCKAPVLAPVASVALVIVTIPDAPNAVVETLPIVALPVTPNVVPIVALLFTVNALVVTLPLEPTDVNKAVLGVTLPIGVACKPPKPLIVVMAVIDPLLVNAAPVTLPVALTVVN